MSHPPQAEADAVTRLDQHLSVFAALVALLQIMGARAQRDSDESEISYPMLHNTDLVLALTILHIGLFFIALWELAKWGLEPTTHRSAETSESPASCQRLKDKAAQAMHTELLARQGSGVQTPSGS